VSPAPAGVTTWQKGEVVVIESRHNKTDPKDPSPIPSGTTTVIARLVKGNGDPLELELQRAEDDDEGPFTATFELDEVGRWSGDIIAAGAFPTKRPIQPWIVRDD
jgi:hypothetical protein